MKCLASSLSCVGEGFVLKPALNLPSLYWCLYLDMATTESCPQFKALLEKEGVPQSFMDWLVTPDVNATTIRAFSACAVSKEKVDPDIIEASGVTLNFWQKVRIRFAWEEWTNLVQTGQGSMSAAPAGIALSKLTSVA